MCPTPANNFIITALPQASPRHYFLLVNYTVVHATLDYYRLTAGLLLDIYLMYLGLPFVLYHATRLLLVNILVDVNILAITDAGNKQVVI